MLRANCWTPLEDALLKQHHGNAHWTELLRLLPGRSRGAISGRAHFLGLTRSKRNHDNPRGPLQYRNADATRLVQESQEAYYWLGFLVADGHFSKSGSIKLAISADDEQQITRFREFVRHKGMVSRTIHGGNRADMLTVSLYAPEVVLALQDSLGVTSQKTYLPPVVERVPDDYFLSFFVGLIDGDGCIRRQRGRRDAIMHILLHPSWADTLNEMAARVYRLLGIARPSPQSKLDSNGYAVIYFAYGPALKGLKLHASGHGLPVLHRKWSCVDETYTGNKEACALWLPKAVALRQAGLTYNTIAMQLRLNLGTVKSKLGGKNGIMRRFESSGENQV